MIFVGGLLDGWSNNVTAYAERFEAANSQIDVKYFAHDQMGALRRFIDGLPRGTPVSLVGHSWGGDTAAQVTAALGQSGRRLDNLVTIDPVGNFTGGSFYPRVSAGAKRWLNVNAAEGQWWSFPNIVAGIGRDYGQGPRGVAQGFFDAPAGHADFGSMLNGTVFGGQTLNARLRGLPLPK